MTSEPVTCVRVRVRMPHKLCCWFFLGYRVGPLAYIYPFLFLMFYNNTLLLETDRTPISVLAHTIHISAYATAVCTICKTECVETWLSHPNSHVLIVFFFNENFVCLYNLCFPVFLGYFFTFLFCFFPFILEFYSVRFSLFILHFHVLFESKSTASG